MSPTAGAQGPESQDPRTRILDAADILFSTKGIDAVTLKDIARPLGLTHAALYYHFPGGKEELFIQVMERNIRRHGAGLDAALKSEPASFRGRLRAAAAWLLSQPPMDLIRMAENDLKALDPGAARALSQLIYSLILLRLQREFAQAAEAGVICPCDPGLLAGGVFGMVESLHSVPVTEVGRPRLEMENDLIDVILKGIEYREGGQ